MVTTKRDEGTGAEKSAPALAGQLEKPLRNGKSIRITAMGTNKRIYKGKEFTSSGGYHTPESLGWNEGEIEKLKKNPNFAVEEFEDGEMVFKKRTPGVPSEEGE